MLGELGISHAIEGIVRKRRVDHSLSHLQERIERTYVPFLTQNATQLASGDSAAMIARGRELVLRRFACGFVQLPLDEQTLIQEYYQQEALKSDERFRKSFKDEDRDASILLGRFANEAQRLIGIAQARVARIGFHPDE